MEPSSMRGILDRLLSASLWWLPRPDVPEEVRTSEEPLQDVPDTDGVSGVRDQQAGTVGDMGGPYGGGAAPASPSSPWSVVRKCENCGEKKGEMWFTRTKQLEGLRVRTCFSCTPRKYRNDATSRGLSGNKPSAAPARAQDS